MDRRWELDALRGLMLVLMTLTHLPTRWSDPLGQPFGFVSAAEGFVFLSGLMAGRVYTQRGLRRGADAVTEAFWRRALKLYAVQAAFMLFFFSAVAAVGLVNRQDAVLGMLGFYFEQPLTAFFAGLTLLYNPPLLDILPMYIVLMIVSPLVLLHGLRHGWAPLLVASLLLWLAAQFDLGVAVREAVEALTASKIPVRHTGAFDLFAWQFLWIAGLWLGAVQAVGDGAAAPRFPAPLVAAAWAWALTCLAWRHAVGQTPFPDHPGLNVLFDKWRVGPLRLLDFFALLLLVLHHGAWLKSRLPRSRVLEAMGAASLPVFCAHLVATLTVLATLGAASPERPWTTDALVLAATFVLLWAVAQASNWTEQRAADVRGRLSARPRTAKAPAPQTRPDRRPGAPRSSTARVHSRRR